MNRDYYRVDRPARPGQPRGARPRANQPRGYYTRRPVARRPLQTRRRVNRRKRIHIVLTLSLLAFLVVGVRLTYAQGIEGATQLKAAEGVRTIDRTLEPVRGAITDRNGQILAMTSADYDIIGDQRVINAEPKELAEGQIGGASKVAAKLGPLLGIDVATLTASLTPGDLNACRNNSPKTLKASQCNMWVVIAKDVSYDTVQKIKATNCAGISAIRSTSRLYPADQYASSVIGFVSGDLKSGSGLERAANKELIGSKGHLQAEVAAVGAGDAMQVIPNGRYDYQPARDGATITTTLDADLQYQATSMLCAQVAKTKSEYGTLIAMNPKTGAVLAFAVCPTFPSSDPSKTNPNLIGNKALTDPYEPGSVAKMITFAAALQEQKVTPSTPVVVPNTITKDGRTYHDAEYHKTEYLTAAGVLAKSSNVGTIEVSEKVGYDTLRSYFEKFGFGKPTGVFSPFKVAESSGIFRAADGDTALQWTMPFGQGIAATSLQMISVAQTIANGGVRIEPRVVSSITDADGNKTPIQGAKTTVISPETAKTMRDMMEGVVTSDGTADAAKIPGYRVAGKTGTAQNASKGEYVPGSYTSSFIGIVPADNPQLVVETVMYKPDPKNYFGGTVAAPLFSQFAGYALAEQGIKPTGTKAPVLPINSGGGQ